MQPMCLVDCNVFVLSGPRRDQSTCVSNDMDSFTCSGDLFLFVSFLFCKFVKLIMVLVQLPLSAQLFPMCVSVQLARCLLTGTVVFSAKSVR